MSARREWRGAIRLGLLTGWLSLSLMAQAQVAAGRITQAVIPGQLTRLAGTTPARIATAPDLGPAPNGMALNRMLLVLRRPGQNELALQTYLDQEREPSSPNYHQWLSPAAVGARFGPAAADVATVTAWLRQAGFAVQGAAAGGLAIEFSGTAGQVASAFHTAIHRYNVGGQLHWANAGDQQIPAALAPVVAGVLSLDDFRRPGGQSPPVFHPFGGSRSAPQFTYEDNLGEVEHALAPADFALIFNTAALDVASQGGQGATIALVARSDVDPADMAGFRQVLLTGTSGTLNTVLDGPDPGIVTDGDDFEATIDAEWASAAAPNAVVDLVVSQPTDTTDGVDLSALYIVDHDLAPVMSTSFGDCEAHFSAAENTFWNELWEQAAAEGISAFVSSGDSGAAGCDVASGSTATQGYGVSGMASPPNVTAVGGTQLDETAVPGPAYWLATNRADGSSALGYIPETAWDEQNATSPPGLWSSGGGQSTLYAKPAWQTATGVPADGARDLPDVALPAAANHDGYLLCFEGSCQQYYFALAGGTSVASPAWAGLMAEITAAMGGRQGGANPALYQLAAGENWASCQASGPPAANCVFLDTTSGNNVVACTAGSRDCAAGSIGSFGFKAGVGYDQVTGLGSVNAANLAAAWKTVTFAASTTALTLTPPANLQHGQPVPYSLQVTAPGGATPTGAVDLLAEYSDGSVSAIQAVTLGASGAAAGSTTLLPGGTYTVVARYGGDLHDGSSLSAATPVTVSPEAATLTAAAYQVNASGEESPVGTVPYGTALYVEARASAASGQGTPTGTVSFTAAVPPNAPINAGTVELNAAGEAPLPFPFAPPVMGSNTLTASYGGDASFQGASAAPISFTITPAGTQTVLVQASGAQGFVLTAQLNTPALAGAAPSGTVTFYDGASVLGTANVDTQPPDASTGTLRASAQLDNPSLGPVARATLTAQYAGDAHYLGSASAALATATPAYLSFAPPSLNFGTVAIGASQTLNATLTNQGGFTSNPITLNGLGAGWTQSGGCQNASLPSGASCTLILTYAPQQPGNGSLSLTATDYSLSTHPAALAVTAAAAGFSAGLGSFNPASISAGATTAVNVAVTPVNGYTGTVALSCSTSAPVSSCAVTPASVTLDGTHAAAATLTVTTTAAAVAPMVPRRPVNWPGWLGCGIFLVLLWLGRAEKRALRWLAAAGGVALATVAMSCGGCGNCGGDSGGNTGNSNPTTTTIGVSPQQLNFGQVVVGKSAELAVTLSDTGSANLALGPIAIAEQGSSTGFSETNNCPATVSAGASCQIQVTYTPAGQASDNAILTISDDNANIRELPVTLNGAGIPDLTVPGSYVAILQASDGRQNVQAQAGFSVH